MVLEENNKFPSVYLGESGRSLHERAKEHWDQYKEKNEKSHIWRHHVLHHGAEGEPAFHIRPLQHHRTALHRQLSEAVLISRRGEENLLNNRGEYNRCQITRLTLGDGKEEGLAKKEEAVDQGENVAEGEEEVGAWTGEKTEEWLQRKTTWAQAGKTADKRKEDSSGRKSSPQKQAKRRRKFDLLGEDWGEERWVVVEGVEPYLPLPQRTNRRGRRPATEKKEDSRVTVKKKMHPFFLTKPTLQGEKRRRERRGCWTRGGGRMTKS